MKTIGLACDHAGFELKEYVRGWLEVKGWAYKDFGTDSEQASGNTCCSLLECRDCAFGTSAQ